jgi:hypothetical protein
LIAVNPKIATPTQTAVIIIFHCGLPVAERIIPIKTETPTIDLPINSSCEDKVVSLVVKGVDRDAKASGLTSKNIKANNIRKRQVPDREEDLAPEVV